MAKSKTKKNKSNKRVGSKKSTAARKPRKSAKKAAQGRRLARYNELVKKIGKREAHAAVFGSKSGKKAGKSKRAGAETRFRVGQPGTRARLFPKILAEVKRNEGTTGMPASPDEMAKAELILEEVYFKGGRPMSVEERVKKQAAEQVRRTKREAAARLVAAKLAEKRKAEAKAAEAEAEAEIAREADKIG